MGFVKSAIAEAIALERGQQPHFFTGSEASPGGNISVVRFRGVVSAEPLDDIGCYRPRVHARNHDRAWFWSLRK